jgi:hypothetical protein
MPEKDPSNWNFAHLFPWLSTFGISLAATMAQYAQKVRVGEKFDWKALALDASICVFVGFVTHMICVAAGIDDAWRSVIVAINAHMGTRAAMQWERLRDRVLGLDKIGANNG